MNLPHVFRQRGAMHDKNTEHTFEIELPGDGFRRGAGAVRRIRPFAGARRPLRRYRKTHPAAKELSVGCRGNNYSIELYAKGDRKPKPEFYALVGSMAAIAFTVTKDDTTTGATRCLKRMGILRGDKVSFRYRRLDMECTRTKTEASIAITRGKDE